MTTKSLRERLLEDDPVAHEPPLDAAGVEQMRRHVLAAGAGPPRRAIAPWLWGSAALATSIAIAALVFVLRDGDRSTAGADFRSERIEHPTDEIPSSAAAAPVALPDAAPDVAPGAPSVAPPVRSPSVAPVTVTVAGPAAGPRLRELQFTTLGGTRLIWLFAPDVNAEVTP